MDEDALLIAGRAEHTDTSSAVAAPRTHLTSHTQKVSLKESVSQSNSFMLC